MTARSKQQMQTAASYGGGTLGAIGGILVALQQFGVIGGDDSQWRVIAELRDRVTRLEVRLEAWQMDRDVREMR